MSSIEVVRRELHPWTSPYGDVRYYIDDWWPLVSDVLERYMEQEWTSPDAKRIRRAKVWFDSSAHIHVDGLKDDIVIEIIIRNIEDRHFQRLIRHRIVTEPARPAPCAIRSISRILPLSLPGHRH